MLYPSRFVRLLVRSATVAVVACTAISLAGCGGYSGTSEFEKFEKKNQSLSDVFTAAGGSAKREGKTLHGYQMAGWMIDLSKAEITDQLLDHMITIAKDDPVFQLNLSGSKITDDQLVKLDEGKVLQKTVDMDLSNTAITDAGLDKIANMYCITTLNLKGSKATMEGARRLGARKIANPTTPAPFKKQPEVKI